MSNVEDGIVSMKFDNDQFQRKLADTITALDKLRVSLEMSGSTRGMTEVAAASRGIDFSPMGSAVDGISAKFLALSTVAITMLSNITTQVLSTAQQMSSAFTLAPVIAGFQEYETNMNSIQTILSNTRADGTSLEQVNGALDQLNQYSDQTIYNFSQMARNIGTFTAAGVNLDTAVPAIKGIANLAAVSGSNAEQASSAMYQLSQALATGTVKLIDWNSIVNAGMGGEVFQKALFTTGQMMGTLESAEVGQTFEEWTAAGNTFRGSLEEGWLTAEVLTNTLQGFTGDLSEAQIMAMGYTQAQAAEIVAMGLDAKGAATEVKTFTQLLGTIKESIASGWSASFRLIIGDFEQAKELFTGINNAIGGFVGRSADARNALLQSWGDLGGREALIDGLHNSFQLLSSVLVPIGRAFRDVFPPITAQRLYDLTVQFQWFIESLKPSQLAMEKFRIMVRTVFKIIDIGIEIVKGIISVFKTFFSELNANVDAGGFVDFLMEITDWVSKLHNTLVTEGGIQEFFNKISQAIRYPQMALFWLQQAFEDIFGVIPGLGGLLGGVEEVTGRVGERFGFLSTVIDNLVIAWHWFQDAMRSVLDVLDEVWGHISTWFSELGSRIADTFTAGDFNAAIDILNVGLLGGVIIMLRRFIGGLSHLGGGIIGTIQEGLEQLTGTLQAMQADLRARALMKIAISIGILALAVTALSLIDPEDLAKALTAIAVGFGELMASMAVMSSSGISGGVGRLAGLAGVMILLSVAVGILSIAVTNFSQLSWEELARGMAGVAGALGLMVIATRTIAADTSGLVRAGVAMIAMGIALNILALAVKSFAEMEWESMAQGLIGIGGALGILVLAMNLMPTSGMIRAGLSILAISVALNVLALAVKSFAEMNFEDMMRGLAGVGVSLGLIALAMNLMPASMPAMAFGILILSAALIVMSLAVRAFASMDLEQLATGIGAIAAMLLVLVVGVNAMSGAVAGAAATVIVAGALLIIVEVLERLAVISIGQLAAGIGAIAAVFTVLGIAAYFIGPLVAPLLGLAAALALVGLGFALFGAGAWMIAKAFEMIVAAGQAGIDILMQIIDVVIDALPRFVGAIVISLLAMVTEILNAAPLLVEAFQVLFEQILSTVIELIPQIAEALSSFIVQALKLIRDNFPEIVATIVDIILVILTAIRDNIGQIIDIGSELIVNLCNGLIDNLPQLVTTVAALIVAFLQELTTKAVALVEAGLGLLTALLQGIAENIGMVMEAAYHILTEFLRAVGEGLGSVVTAGFDILMALLRGIADNIMNVITTVVDIILQFVLGIGQNINRIIDAGFYVLTEFLRGMSDNINAVVVLVGYMITSFIEAVGGEAIRIADAGADMLMDFLEAITEDIPRIASRARDLIITFIRAIGENSLMIIEAGAEMLLDFLNGLADAIEEYMPQIIDAGGRIGGALIDGMTGGLAGRAGDAIGAVTDVAGNLVGGALDAFGIGCPSKVFFTMGERIAEGLALGLNRDTSAVNSAESLAQRSIDAFRNILRRIPFELAGMADLNPVITPVLDLTKIQAEARNLDRYIGISDIRAQMSIDRARVIATTTEQERDSSGTPSYDGPQSVTFEQNNYSPTALSTNDIYRNTRSQIALAKEELNIA